MPPALRLTDVRKAFGGRAAVDDVELVVPPGPLLGLVGPNGAGKTTALSMAVCLLRPDGGRSEGVRPGRVERAGRGEGVDGRAPRRPGPARTAHRPRLAQLLRPAAAPRPGVINTSGAKLCGQAAAGVGSLPCLTTLLCSTGRSAAGFSRSGRAGCGDSWSGRSAFFRSTFGFAGSDSFCTSVAQTFVGWFISHIARSDPKNHTVAYVVETGVVTAETNSAGRIATS